MAPLFNLFNANSVTLRDLENSNFRLLVLIAASTQKETYCVIYSSQQSVSNLPNYTKNNGQEKKYFVISGISMSFLDVTIHRDRISNAFCCLFIHISGLFLDTLYHGIFKPTTWEAKYAK